MKKINIALVGLGQIGNYLYNELNIKKKNIQTKTGKKINIVAISAKDKKDWINFTKKMDNILVKEDDFFQENQEKKGQYSIK